jgi:glutamine cyclotransferase
MLILSVLLLPGAACDNADEIRPEQLRPKIISTFPHDPEAFTQGLIVTDGSIYESTGLYKRSTLRRLDRKTGKILNSVALPPHLFGEGIARVNDRIVQLTYEEQVAWVFDLKSLQKTNEFTYKGEGWGLCFDGKRFIMSDGSDRLYFRDATTFEILGDVRVRLMGEPLDRINELECVDGFVYGNVFPRDIIVRIDPATGAVNAVIDTSDLISPWERGNESVTNGIAYDFQTKTFLMTGKFWPKMFEVVFVPK